jgi:hypothetical protein
MFCTESFVDGINWSVIDVLRVADTLLMDGIIPAIKAVNRAVYAAVRWAEKWVAPILVCVAQIAWVIWQDLIVWGIDRYIQSCLEDEQSAIESTEPIALLPAAELVETAQDATTLEGMTSQQLRNACKVAGVQWRNVRGKGKHLTKAQMVESLSQMATANHKSVA